MSIKITLYEFSLLSEEKQYDIIFTEGIFLDSRIYGNERFALYSVDMFFVEVEYDNYSNKILKAVPFVSGEKLNKYSAIL